jgi:hypothetical protein
MTMSDKLITREDLADPHRAMPYEERLAQAAAVDLRNNAAIIDHRDGYVSIVPIDPNKRWGGDAAAERERIKVRLAQHWLVELRCNHEDRTDEAVCSCALWGSGPRPTVGDAVQARIEHATSAET